MCSVLVKALHPNEIGLSQPRITSHNRTFLAPNNFQLPRHSGAITRDIKWLRMGKFSVSVIAWLPQLSPKRYTHFTAVPVPGKSADEQLASQMVGEPGHSLSQRIQLLLAHHAVGAAEEAPGRRLFHCIRAWLRSRSTVAQSSPHGSRPRLAPLNGRNGSRHVGR